MKIWSARLALRLGKASFALRPSYFHRGFEIQKRGVGPILAQKTLGKACGRNLGINHG